MKLEEIKKSNIKIGKNSIYIEEGAVVQHCILNTTNGFTLGVVANNIHKKGWKVLYAVYIGSPLHGARLLNQLEKIVPTNIRDALYKKPYGILQKCTRASEPDHDYNTISMGWFNTEFDGCVYKDEVVLNEDKHVHLCWADHRTIFANPRLWTLVGNLLTKKLNKI